MPDLINYVATSGGHAYFGMAEDPAAEIAEMQAASPHQIDLEAGWVLAPPTRMLLLDSLRRALRGKHRRGQWFRVSSKWATSTLAFHAETLGGTPWKVRKRPRPSEAAENQRVRAVVTPHDRYPSIAAAAQAHGITRQSAWERATRRALGWRFEDDIRPQPELARRGRPPKSE